jgi:AcrR family transcriptional regulator
MAIRSPRPTLRIRKTKDMDAPMTYAEFNKIVTISKKDIYQETIAENRETMRVKKEKTVAKNLEKIFGAVLKISNRKGFKAMSMRDLSRESGLSMGALYSYFSSKDELLEMLQHQQRSISERILKERVNAEHHRPEQIQGCHFHPPLPERSDAAVVLFFIHGGQKPEQGRTRQSRGQRPES